MRRPALALGLLATALLLAPAFPALAGDGGGSSTTCSALLPAPLPAPVCATATAIVQVNCVQARIQLSCGAVAQLGGAGGSGLMLPGDVSWSGIAYAEMCRGTALPCPAAKRVAASGSAAWEGLLVLGPDGAASGETLPIMSVVIDTPAPGDCIVWSVAAAGSATAVVVRTDLPGPVPFLDQAQAGASGAETGSFCVGGGE